MRLSETLGLNDLYFLGCISVLHMLIGQIKDNDSLTRKDLIMYIEHFEEELDCSDNVKNLIEEVLKEVKA